MKWLNIRLSSNFFFLTIIIVLGWILFWKRNYFENYGQQLLLEIVPNDGNSFLLVGVRDSELFNNQKTKPISCFLDIVDLSKTEDGICLPVNYRTGILLGEYRWFKVICNTCNRKITSIGLYCSSILGRCLELDSDCKATSSSPNLWGANPQVVRSAALEEEVLRGISIAMARNSLPQTRTNSCLIKDLRKRELSESCQVVKLPESDVRHQEASKHSKIHRKSIASCQNPASYQNENRSVLLLTSTQYPIVERVSKLRDIAAWFSDTRESSPILWIIGCTFTVVCSVAWLQ